MNIDLSFVIAPKTVLKCIFLLVLSLVTNHVSELYERVAKDERSYITPRIWLLFTDGDTAAHSPSTTPPP